MFRLRVVGVAENFPNKNLSSTSRGVEPKKNAQYRRGVAQIEELQKVLFRVALGRLEYLSRRICPLVPHTDIGGVIP